MREAILKDLGRTLITRLTKDSLDMLQLCDVANIPRYESEIEASGAFLYLFMALISCNKPLMTPEELAFIVRHQYQMFRKEVAKNVNSRP